MNNAELDVVPELQAEYIRWCKEAGDDTYASRNFVGIHEVLRAHCLIVDHFWKQREGVGGIGPKSMHLLHSAVSRQTTSFQGTRKWKNEFEICATLFFGLVKNHPFHDCNKRTALLTALNFMRIIGRKPTVGHQELERLTIRTAEGGLNKYSDDFDRFKSSSDPEVYFLAHYLRRNTTKIDKREYTISYQQLGKILARYGFWFSDPDNNYIHIVGKAKRRTGFLRLKEEEYEKKIIKVRFPGMKAQVNVNTVRDIRKACGLTHAHGYDSEVFYRGADPMQSLLASYSSLMLRLANR